MSITAGLFKLNKQGVPCPWLITCIYKKRQAPHMWTVSVQPLQYWHFSTATCVYFSLVRLLAISYGSVLFSVWQDEG